MQYRAVQAADEISLENQIKFRFVKLPPSPATKEDKLSVSGKAGNIWGTDGGSMMITGKFDC
jgi:hypothetical protein